MATIGRIGTKGSSPIGNTGFRRSSGIWREIVRSQKPLKTCLLYTSGKTFLRGEDVDQDLPRAELLLRRSSDQGNRYASYTLGKTLLDGELLLQNIPEAIRLLTDSADKGFAAGQYQMGKLLYRGEMVPQDISLSLIHI